MNVKINDDVKITKYFVAFKLETTAGMTDRRVQKVGSWDECPREISDAEFGWKTDACWDHLKLGLQKFTSSLKTPKSLRNDKQTNNDGATHLSTDVDDALRHAVAQVGSVHPRHRVPSALPGGHFCWERISRCFKMKRGRDICIVDGEMFCCFNSVQDTLN